MERRRALDGPLPRRVVTHQAARSTLPSRRVVRRVRRAARASRRCRPRWRSPACCATSPATRSSARGSCRSSPTRPARSAWTRCSASSRSTPSQGQQYEPVDAQLLLSYTESRRTARSSRRASPRPARMASFTAAGTAYATRGVPMVPFFIFYSMFGFQRVGDLIWAAADAAGTRLPARRHRRPHDAARRGPAAPGRPQPRAGVDGARRARPTTRRSPTRWRRSSSTASTACTGPTQPGGRLLLPHPLQRELRDAGRWPDGVDRRRSSTACTVGRRARRRRRRRGHDPVLGLGAGRGPRRRRPSWPSTTTSAPSCGRPRRTSGCARRRCRPSAGTGCTPTSRRARRTCHRSCSTTDGPDRRRHRLHEGGARPDRPLGARRPRFIAARHRRLRPQRHPRGAAPVLRDRRRPRRGRRARRWPRTARPRPRTSPRPSRTTIRSTPRPPTPASRRQVLRPWREDGGEDEEPRQPEGDAGDDVRDVVREQRHPRHGDHTDQDDRADHCCDPSHDRQVGEQHDDDRAEAHGHVEGMARGQSVLARDA